MSQLVNAFMPAVKISIYMGWIEPLQFSGNPATFKQMLRWLETYLAEWVTSCKSPKIFHGWACRQDRLTSKLIYHSFPSMELYFASLLAHGIIPYVLKNIQHPDLHAKEICLVHFKLRIWEKQNKTSKKKPQTANKKSKDTNQPGKISVLSESSEILFPTFCSPCCRLSQAMRLGFCFSYQLWHC